MEGSILTEIKKLMGIGPEEDHFDIDLTIHINSALTSLTGIGVGPEQGYSISNADQNWIDFIPNADPSLLNIVKTYIYLKVKLIFDPPASSISVTSFTEAAAELLWRASVLVDPPRNVEE